MYNHGLSLFLSLSKKRISSHVVECYFCLMLGGARMGIYVGCWENGQVLESGSDG